jgi:outer membrane lipoprotein-sorting protein
MKPLLLAFLLFSSTPPDNSSVVDPAAQRVLDSMMRAYRDVHKLEQETAYHQEGGSGNGLVRSRLVVQKPNRLFLELVQQTADRSAPMLSRFVCDGKNFYSYQEKNGWYNKDKAPKDLKDFDFLALSVEMAALTGNDPVKGLIKQARFVRMTDSVLIDGDMADVVVFDTGNADQFGELRLAIDKKDHLLRRFAIETRPLVKPKPEGDKTPLLPGETEAPLPFATSFSYDIHVMTGREQSKDAFTWVAPPGSFPCQSYPTLLDPKPGKAQPVDPSAGMPPGVKPMKIISIQDLIKNAQKPNQKKKK